MTALLRHLGTRSLIVVTGKGGVGKSAIAAALAQRLAVSGRRTIVLELDPRESQHQLLGTPPSAGEFVEAAERLWLQNLRPRMVLEQMVRERLKVAAIAKRVTQSPVFQPFVEGAPGLQQLGALAHALRLVRGEAGRKAPRVNTVVLDAPATGHGLSLLEAPRLVSEVISEGPFGRMAIELTEYLADGSASGVVAVTLAEEMPVEEFFELDEALRSRFGRPPDAVVVNALYPPLRSRKRGTEPLRELWRRRRAVNERELVRLRARWHGLACEVPLLPIERGPALVDAIGERL